MHYTHASPSNYKQPGRQLRAVHLLHGFGGNTTSWEPCRQQLADALHAEVTAHDQAGFGLSQRSAFVCRCCACDWILQNLSHKDKIWGLMSAAS